MKITLTEKDVATSVQVMRITQKAASRHPEFAGSSLMMRVAHILLDKLQVGENNLTVDELSNLCVCTLQVRKVGVKLFDEGKSLEKVIGGIFCVTDCDELLNNIDPQIDLELAQKEAEKEG